jgi:hypothetical protein
MMLYELSGVRNPLGNDDADLPQRHAVSPFAMNFSM